MKSMPYLTAQLEATENLDAVLASSAWFQAISGLTIEACEPGAAARIHVPHSQFWRAAFDRGSHRFPARSHAV